MNTLAPRLRDVNKAPINNNGDYVLYWMIAARRVSFNFALEHASSMARELGLPLVVFEALRAGYTWASDRLHTFVLEGMADTARRLGGRPVTYYPYVEPEPGAGRGLLEALAARAAMVVTDDYPAFFLPRMVKIAGEKLNRRLVAVDGNGLLPMAAADREFATAYSFRRFLQRTLPNHLSNMPLQDPLIDSAPVRHPTFDEIENRWPSASAELLDRPRGIVELLPIDHSVPPAPVSGGTTAAEAALRIFLNTRVDNYNERRNLPDEEGSSGLSPYLHFGHLSPHQVFLELMTLQRWTPEDISSRADGRRSGWWGAGESTEAFLDQLITWREIGFNLCFCRDDHDQYSAVPDWARRTLEEHLHDPRDFVYSEEELAASATHDTLWNAAQRQLVREGRIHNYLRMLWGKKILKWSETPQQALATMFELNNRYALDGRDPNSSSGILWILGRFDRAWGPERPIFGKVRYMTSANTARKLPVRKYLERYGSDSGGHQ